MSWGRGIWLVLFCFGFSTSFPLINSMLRPKVAGVGLTRVGAVLGIATSPMVPRSSHSAARSKDVQMLRSE